MVNEQLRGYRRGVPYRNGDVKKDNFISEFKFEDIIYNEDYTESDKKRYLNYTYDALKDLSSILNIPVNVLSLQNSKNEKTSLYFGDANKGKENLVINKNGSVSQKWVYFLDKFLANEYNSGSSFYNSLSNLDNSEPLVKLSNILISTLIKKEVVKEDSEITSDTLEEYKDNLYDLIDSMPFKDNADLDLIATIEDVRKKFVDTLTMDSYNEMVTVFEQNGMNIDNVKEPLLDILVKAQNEYNELSQNANSNREIVDTNFLKGCKNRNNKENSKKYTDNLELVVQAVQAYINKKLKDISCYNNFLVSQNDINEIIIDIEEEPIIFGAVENYFSRALPIISSILTIKEDKEKDEVKNEDITEKSKNIDKIVNEDKGKFKLTLFKKLAKDVGLKVDFGKTYKAEFGVYYIYFTDGYIKYIKPTIYYNPNQKGHCINIYCGSSGDTKLGYIWDNDLDYNDLVHYLLSIENKNRKENVKNEPKVVRKDVEKFKLTEFKLECNKENLGVDKSETPIIDNKYTIRFNNRYIVYMIAPVYISISDKKEQKIKIKTLREEIYHTWRGSLNYTELLKKLVEIEKQGQAALQEEKEELLRKKEKVERERENLISKVNKTSLEYEKSKELSDCLDCSNIKTSKDIRDRLYKYVQLQNVNLGYGADVNTLSDILKSNVMKIDGEELNISSSVIVTKDLMGNSKVWSKQGNNCLFIQNRADARKQLEGLIEGFVDFKLSSKNYSKVQKQMFRESLTFMLCRKLGLDVRTYCNSQLFERFIKSGEKNIKNYILKSMKLYDSILIYFKMN